MEGNQQRAVVTGGQGELAQAIVAELAACGLEVLAPGRAQLDVADGSSVADYFRQLENDGGVDLLVCNAGLVRDGLLLKMTESSWDEVMQVNLAGAMRCAQAVLRGMVKRRRGHVVLISSFSAVKPPAGQVNYAAAKAGLHGFAKSLAAEVGGRGIRVNVVMPGFLPSKMTEHVAGAARERVEHGHVMGGVSDAADAAKFIRFLHLEMARTSGQIFNLDGRVMS